MCACFNNKDNFENIEKEVHKEKANEKILKWIVFQQFIWNGNGRNDRVHDKWLSEFKDSLIYF